MIDLLQRSQGMMIKVGAVLFKGTYRDDGSRGSGDRHYCSCYGTLYCRILEKMHLT